MLNTDQKLAIVKQIAEYSRLIDPNRPSAFYRRTQREDLIQVGTRAHAEAARQI